MQQIEATATAQLILLQVAIAALELHGIPSIQLKYEFTFGFQTQIENLESKLISNHSFS